MTWMAVTVLGLVAGVTAGLFGVGGAALIIPGLVLGIGLPQHVANGTSLAALLLPVGLLGVLEYYRRGEVHVPYVALLAAGLFIGTYAGAQLAGIVPDEWLRRGFGALLLIVSLRLLIG